MNHALGRQLPISFSMRGQLLYSDAMRQLARGTQENCKLDSLGTEIHAHQKESLDHNFPRLTILFTHYTSCIAMSRIRLGLIRNRWVRLLDMKRTRAHNVLG